MRLLIYISLICLAVILQFTDPGISHAADHLDGEVATADPAADITDVYAWMQNGDKINLVLDVFPLASASSRFSDSVEYVFRVNSQASYGGNADENLLVCTFSVAQTVTCELDGQTLVADVDASGTAGVTTADGSFRIFTGIRNDPFFFDLDNFKATRATVRDAVPSLTFDTAGCPTLDAGTQAVLVSSLTGGGGVPGAHSPAKDFFRDLNALAIVIQADKTIFGAGPLYSVSATTHRVN